MCKFATSPKFDGLDSFTVILRPFTQLLVDAIQGTGGQNPTNTIKRIVYGFAQLYPVMLARLCRVWAHIDIDAEALEDSDDDENENENSNSDRLNRVYPKYLSYKAVFDVSSKIVDNILL